ncbi:KLH21 protein, partial [Polyodon spathula]|nr:KLH21 protein [Polyodon spathula]
MDKPPALLVTQSSTLPFFDTAHALNLLRGIHELRAERKFFDVTLCAEGREFPCHRTVLAATSNYFKAMFAGTLRESGMDRVELHEVSATVLGLLVDFCYTGRATVSHENVDPLLKGADLFQFPSVKEACCCFLEQRLDVSNCLELQDFAEAYACRGLAESARRFALRNVVELAKGPDFERLPLKRLLELVSDDRLCVDKEETAYLMVSRWVKADPQRRLHLWPELFQRVRLPFVRRYFLLAHVESDPLVYTSPSCLGLVAEARAFQSAGYDRHDQPCERVRPRPSTGLAEILVVIGGCDQDCDELVTVDCYNPHTGHWRYLAEFPEHLGGGYSISALGNDIYVTGRSHWGGSTGFDFLISVSIIIIIIIIISIISSSSIISVVIICLMTLLFIQRHVPQCSVPQCSVRCAPVQCAVCPSAVCPSAMCPSAVCSVPHSLTPPLCSCRDDSAEVDVFNPLKNEWDAIPPMTQVHVGGSVAPLGGKLFVSGGYDDTFELSDVVEAYDPSTGTWSRAARLPQPTFWHGSVSIFRQFMPSAPIGFEAGLDNANNEVNAVHLHRHQQNHRAQALLHQNQNLNQLH